MPDDASYFFKPLRGDIDSSNSSRERATDQLVFLGHRVFMEGGAREGKLLVMVGPRAGGCSRLEKPGDFVPRKRSPTGPWERKVIDEGDDAQERALARSFLVLTSLFARTTS